MSQLTDVTDASFRSDVLESPLPVLVDFWATWCGPCKMIEHIVEEIARQYQGQLKVVRVNADDHAQTAMDYGVMGLPLLLLFVDGQPAPTRLVGYVTKEQVLSYLAQHGVERQADGD